MNTNILADFQICISVPLKRVLSCLKRFLFPVKSKKPNMGGGAGAGAGARGGGRVDNKMWGKVLILHFGKMGGSL